jgi:hypothetical protein
VHQHGVKHNDIQQKQSAEQFQPTQLELQKELNKQFATTTRSSKSLSYVRFPTGVSNPTGRYPFPGQLYHSPFRAAERKQYWTLVTSDH